MPSLAAGDDWLRQQMHTFAARAVRVHLGDAISSTAIRNRVELGQMAALDPRGAASKSDLDRADTAPAACQTTLGRYGQPQHFVRFAVRHIAAFALLSRTEPKAAGATSRVHRHHIGPIRIGGWHINSERCSRRSDCFGRFRAQDADHSCQGVTWIRNNSEAQVVFLLHRKRAVGTLRTNRDQSDPALIELRHEFRLIRLQRDVAKWALDAAIEHEHRRLSGSHCGERRRIAVNIEKTARPGARIRQA